MRNDCKLLWQFGWDSQRRFEEYQPSYDGPNVEINSVWADHAFHNPDMFSNFANTTFYPLDFGQLNSASMIVFHRSLCDAMLFNQYFPFICTQGLFKQYYYLSTRVITLNVPLVNSSMNSLSFFRCPIFGIHFVLSMAFDRVGIFPGTRGLSRVLNKFLRRTRTVCQW